MLIFVKPKEGVAIRRPDTGRMLDEAGEQVPKNTFWRRRIAEGDVEEMEPPKAHKKKKHAEEVEPAIENASEGGAE